MTRYADPERCPDCLGAMPWGASTCPSCGLSLEGPLAARLFATLSSADELLATMRSAAPAGLAPSAPGPAPDAAGHVLPGATDPPVVREPLWHGLSNASVPKILLGLGALCLLVAALVFLAVSWSAMGVAARTATLLGFTAVAGALTGWAARHDLRAGAESLGVVTLGLLAFDLFGARDSGWFGDVSTSGFLLLAGTLLTAAGAGTALALRRTPTGGLVGAEVMATIGLGAAAIGVASSDALTWSASLVIAVLLAGGLAVTARLVRLGRLAGGAALVSTLAWCALTLTGLERASNHPSLRELWLELEGWPLLAAAVLVGVPMLVPRVPLPARQASLAVSALVVAVTVLVPFTDAPVTELTTAGAGLAVAAAVLAWLLPTPWRAGITPVLGLGTLWMLAVAWILGGVGLGGIGEAGSAWWTGDASGSFPGRDTSGDALASWLLPLAVLAAVVGLVALARALPPVDRVVAPLADLDALATVAGAVAVLTLAMYPVPLWLTLLLLLTGATALVARGLRHGAFLPLGLASGVLALALAQSLHAEWHTFTFLAVGLVLAALVHLRSRALEVAVVGGALVSACTAGLAWTAGVLLDVPAEWTALAALVLLCALALGLPYLDRRVRRAGPFGHARLGLEVTALVAGLVVTAAGVDLAVSAPEATWLAVYLTVLGGSASAMALLRPDRRSAGWIGGLLLAAATWVRLADLGVDTPEAYTLPSATALVVVGLAHLRRNRGSSTLSALSPGLALALTPSLLWVLADPVTLRSVLLGAGCAGLIAGGLRLRWGAPVLWATAVGTLLVLRHATPVAEAVPRWALIGLAGALLVTAGITWEQRVRDARVLAGHVRALR